MQFKMQFSIVLLSLALICFSLISSTDANMERHKIRTVSKHSALHKRGGRATFYKVGLGNCGGTNSDHEMVVAIAEEDVKGRTTSRCGQTVEITNLKTKIVKTAKVVDLCPIPFCSSGSLDMSPALFKSLGGTEAEGVFPISYKFGGGSSSPSSSSSSSSGSKSGSKEGSKSDDKQASSSHGSSSNSKSQSDDSSIKSVGSADGSQKAVKSGSGSTDSSTGSAHSQSSDSDEDDSETCDEDEEDSEEADDDDNDDEEEDCE